MEVERRVASTIEQTAVPADHGRAVQLVRLRLALVIIATALMASLAGSGVAAVVAPDLGGHVGDLVRRAPLLTLVGAVVLFEAAFTLTLVLARRVVAPARQLDAARRRFGDLYVASESRALVDPLTGLGNHRAFQEEFERQIDLSRRHSYPLALVLLDLDDFKAVNESAGHATGDLVLGQISTLLRAVFRKSDRLYRIGGDEFAVLLPHSSVENGFQATRRLLATALTPRTAGPFREEFSFSAGVTGAPELGASRIELIDQADEALAKAKQEGRTLIKVYDPEHSTRALDGPMLARASTAVATLIERRAVRPVYQPIVELIGGTVVGFEGLVRPVPESGFETPLSLFRAAEAGGRTIELDRLCIETLLEGAGVLDPGQWLSLNISPRTVEAPEFSAAWLQRLLAHATIGPARILLEVTEREAIQDLDVVRRRLAACQALGMRVAIDDVGAGNAGLRLLSELRFNVVKVDMTLVHAAAQDETSRGVLRSIAELARSSGATAIAEGIETPTQLHVVRDIGLPAAQGYLLGRPSPIPDLRSIDLESISRESDLRAELVGALHGWQVASPTN